MLMILSAVSNLLTAQFHYFNEIFDIEQSDQSIGSNIEVVGDSYFTFGAFSGSLVPLFLQQLNLKGEEVQTNSHNYWDWEYINYADSFQKSSDGNFLWGGGIIGSGIWHGIMSKFDTQFNVSWTFEYDDVEFSEYHMATEISDGYIACGHIPVSYNGGFDYEYSDLLISKFDTSGDVVWHRVLPVFNQQYFLRITKVFEMDDGNLVVFGSHYADYENFILKLDSLGNYISEYSWGSPLWDWIPWPVDIGGGEFMAAWQESHYYYQGDAYPETPVSTPHLKKINANTMLEEWDVEYEVDTILGGHIGNLEQTWDNGFVMCFNTPYWDDVLGEQQSCVLLKTDILGNREWSKEYWYTPDLDFAVDLHYVYDIEIANDGGFVICGTYEEDAMGDKKIWVYKTDCMGNLEQPDLVLYPVLIQINDGMLQCEVQTENLNNFIWDMGDGSESLSGDSIVHQYSESGTYEISLSGEYCYVQFDTTLSMKIEILDCMGNTDTPDLIINYNNEQLNDSTFTFTSSPENLTDITWDFIDETTAAGNEAVHSYLSSGEFEVIVCGVYCDSLYCESFEVTATVGIQS